MTTYTAAYSIVFYVASYMNSIKTQLLLSESFVEFLAVGIRKKYSRYLYLASLTIFIIMKQFNMNIKH